MEDINNIILGFPINLIYSIIFIVFLVFLTFLYLFNKKPITSYTKINNFELKPINNKKDFLKILSLFQKKYLDSSKDIFYKKISEILKEIILQEKNNDISKLTFQEINNLKIDSKLIDLIKSIYFKEYEKDIKDSQEIREELISKIRKLI